MKNAGARSVRDINSRARARMGIVIRFRGGRNQWANLNLSFAARECNVNRRE